MPIITVHRWAASHDVRGVRAWLAVAAWTAGVTALPPLTRWAAHRAAPMGDAYVIEWWSAVAWSSVVAVAASIAVRWGGRSTPIARRWPAWRAGALRFAMGSGTLVALMSIRTGVRDVAFDADRASALVRTTLLPALTEELVFRGVMAAAVSAALVVVVRDPRVRAGVSLVVVSLAFALAHEGGTRPAVGWPLIAARFAAGLVFGALALRDRTLLAAMLAHAMYDAAVARCW